MRLLDLSLENVGPFDQARLEFLSAPDDPVPVTIITGQNGAGKSIVLDAIRGLFGWEYGQLERPIWREGVPFRAEMTLEVEEGRKTLTATRGFGSHEKGFGLDSNEVPLLEHVKAIRNLPEQILRGHLASCRNWVVDFWRSSLPMDTYAIKDLGRQDPKTYLVNALKGIQHNADVTRTICYFDYLRSSEDPGERRDGEKLFEDLRRIVKASLLEGEFSHVRRTDFTPMIKQSGQLVPLSNLSSGNAYLIQHMLSLLWKMYALHLLRGTDTDSICQTPGLLLIDEAENHLHPIWQKRFLLEVRSVFPNVQVIATTHSPFIVASIPGARLYVCRYEPSQKCCVIEEETEAYANKPVEDILLSPAFEETAPFSENLTRLLRERKAAADAGNEERQREIEAELKKRNPEYFSYLDVEERLAALRGTGS